jgi:hypothetical protein
VWRGVPGWLASGASRDLARSWASDVSLLMMAWVRDRVRIRVRYVYERIAVHPYA